ncbi:amidohydrolase family protein [Halomicronema sp. CCY15110]|uniref:amidohydrolase family protein n=1 Tax=Halomicronema sp. CCY15110 TaxID=2767773 RepID=UPI00195200FB|nr:amidohydrolase family protein [Halomicronema sp. CCY15110]
MHPLDLLIRQARLPDGSRAQVAVKAGKIHQIASPEVELGDAHTVLDLQGDLLCPGLVDGHIHLDKTFWGAPWQPHILGNSVKQRVEIEKQLLKTLTVPVEQRAAHLLEQAIANGTTLMRTHVDIHPEVGLRNLEGIVQVRDRYRDYIDIQIVAFPQSGLISCPGTLALLDQALTEGADVIGGLDPAGMDQDIAGHLDAVFSLAEKHGVDIDIHLHDPAQLGIFELEQIIQRTEALGMLGHVVVSHAYCLGMVSADLARTTAEHLARAGIAIMTTAPGHLAFPPVTLLRELGIPVFSGSDDVRNAWCPFSKADMLERAALIAYRSDFRTDAELSTAFAIVTADGAKVIQGATPSFSIGAVADFIVVAADSIPAAVATQPLKKYVIKNGQVTVRKGELSRPMSLVQQV